MSDSSDQMEFSPTNFEQVAACEKLRDTVTGISALHMSIQGMDERSPSPRNSFKDLYLSTQAMIRRKEEMPRTVTCDQDALNVAKITLLEIVTSKSDKKTRFVSTARTSVTRHVIQNPSPKFPQPKKGTAFSNPIARKSFSSKWTKEGISFANVVSGEIPSQTHPKTENLTVNEKENSSSGFLTHENNSSDFPQVLELINTISNLVKKTPKILDLLSKFKSANSDEEKTCLLAEAIMNNI
ncbi:hypothetical protein TNCV_4534901 [Trichonephila clavipes]|nr:hypothetical protein TNCV_4534901 [Trichonephila clavipes]